MASFSLSFLVLFLVSLILIPQGFAIREYIHDSTPVLPPRKGRPPFTPPTPVLPPIIVRPPPATSVYKSPVDKP
ncbi:hypothetical protein P8452_24536 [Trifolium repens]|nr:hypothetical protein P8452_19203 [Trifolium repens]WJX36683.1 hypothetical protein P8452_24536 [Trifolium repens]